MATQQNTTKTPTTYNKVKVGDMIDGEVIISKRRHDGHVTLCFSSELAWGPWTPANTPVSVWR
ncbi:hypothetical protein [Actinocrispum wychmicini]|uniref:Uncharacterized protein n=1 Tax=Actinocrispum wychmicini TaxID=1213861 RepID=A0A4R2JC85_9PSEU|nr:hypothetical protein [Actinocrispum wychmicini]TCO57153.1 hypothetical protein EV192_106630 [Actinocrispum wychmicini]